MSQHFTHLHLHTEYSLLDGAISLDKLIDFGKKNDMKALAITDHGNVFGAVKFFQKTKKAGIKPILGIETYLTEDIHIKKDADKKYYHLILLVMNKQGYHNLCKLISHSYQEGFYFKPRIDYRLLQQYSEGLIATTACLGGHIPNLLMSEQRALVDERVDWFLNVFGPERFYLEVQPEDQQDQVTLNKHIFDLSKRTNLQVIATGDCHYVNADDHEAHEVMLSIQTHDQISNPNRYTFGDCRVYMRTAQQMLDIFSNNPEVVWNTGRVADMCEFDFETGKLFFPNFEIPSPHTQESFFKHLCQEGLERLISDNLIPHEQRDIYQARLDSEMDLITRMGFIGYFLVVSDFIQWAYRVGIPVGPGRGSAAGSLVAWTLQITNIDPIKYNLLFERFLNPERISMPDIDIDFCIEGRDKVINYVRDKYGHDKVCHIITFGTMLAKGVIKDVARALGFPFEDSNMITNLIPDQLKITLNEALEQEPRLQELINTNSRVKRLFEIAFKLEGLTRHASKHAAGIVISPEPIDHVLPVYVPPKTTELVAQYAMTELESIGFLKIDFLGLKNLTLIDRVTRLIAKNYGITLDMNKIPLDDPNAFKLICAGNTSGVFQLESNGLKDVLRKLQPDKFEDIIAVNALYRPGPLGSGMVDDYIERRHGRQPIRYLFDELAPILEETYGVIVYQEQVMKIASTIGGYSLGEADILRRAMGKKKADEMAKQREIFTSRAIAKGFDQTKSEELFDLMAYFAGYGFNKSHSAAYALIAYQTAFLKANYPAEFMACLISLEADDAEKMAFYLQEAKDLGIPLLPPDINRSDIHFSVVDNQILFGLLGIKNVGLAALENIIAERDKKPFTDILDLCKRIDLRTGNKRVLENLICSGALDMLPGSRAQKFTDIGTIIDRAIAIKRDEETGQMDLFGIARSSTQQNNTYEFSTQVDWNNQEKLEREKEVIGFYLSAHPLETYRDELRWFKPISFEQAKQNANQYNAMNDLVVTCCGLLTSKKIITTKKGDRMAFIQLEDASGIAEIVLFPKTFARAEKWLETYPVFFVRGGVDVASSMCKLKANDFVPAELMLTEWPSLQTLTIHVDHVQKETLEEIKATLVPGNTKLHIQFEENNKQLCLQTKTSVMLDKAILQKIEQLNVTLSIA